MTTTNRRRLGWGTVLAVVLLAAVFTGAQDRGRKVTGVVIDAASGDPVVGARVEYEDHAELSLGVQVTTTDDKGRFEIPGGIRGVASITASGFGTARHAWPPAFGVAIRAEMVPPVVVNGVMFDLVTGQGVEGDVTLVVHNRNNIVSDSAEARGTFRIVDAPPGPAMVFARANSYAPYFNTFDVDAGKHYSLRVGLLLEAAASGVVLDSAGEPAPGAEVRAIYDDSFRGAHLFASLAGGENTNADDEGAFRLGGLVPDTPLRVRAFLGDRTSNTAAVEAGPGSVQAGIVLRLRD